MRASSVCTFGWMLEAAIGKRAEEFRLQQEVLEARRVDADVTTLDSLLSLFVTRWFEYTWTTQQSRIPRLAFVLQNINTHPLSRARTRVSAAATPIPPPPPVIAHTTPTSEPHHFLSHRRSLYLCISLVLWRLLFLLFIVDKFLFLSHDDDLELLLPPSPSFHSLSLKRASLSLSSRLTAVTP